ncbi:hypothetical protein KCP77_20155 [Salmonella enterica subsp. enterica]|nr:hypothetical protein KCP77_20155 [Salmonella enterica subsp. enterica]
MDALITNFHPPESTFSIGAALKVINTTASYLIRNKEPLEADDGCFITAGFECSVIHYGRRQPLYVPMPNISIGCRSRRSIAGNCSVASR